MKFYQKCIVIEIFMLKKKFCLFFHKNSSWAKTVNFNKKALETFLVENFMPIDNHKNKILVKMFRYRDI